MDAFLDDLRRMTAADVTDEWFVRALLGVTPHIPMLAAFDVPAAGNGYRRTLLHSEEAFEIVLMRWNGKVETPVHDHGGQRCWFTVIDGSIGVENFTRGSRTSSDVIVRSKGSALLRENDVDARLGDDDLHKCFVPGERALTLHLYADPLRDYNVYDLTTRSITKQRSSYDNRCMLWN